MESTSKISTPPERLCEDCSRPLKDVYNDIMHRWFTLPCPVCEAAQKERRERQEAEQQRLRVEQKVQEIIPPLYHKARMDDLSDKLVTALITKPCEQSLLLWGPTGTGKTYTASALGRMYIEDGKRVRRAVFNRLMLELMGTFKNREQSENDILRPLLTANITIIEDLGASQQGAPESNYCQRRVLDIIDYRLEQEKPTIITSNLSAELLGQAYGERTASRLKEFMVIRLGGDDKRGRHG